MLPESWDWWGVQTHTHTQVKHICFFSPGGVCKLIWATDVKHQDGGSLQASSVEAPRSEDL